MRLLLLGVASIALSGCSWIGLGGSKHSNNYNHHNGHYSKSTTSHKVSGCQGQCLSRWNLEAAIGPEFIIDGNGVTGDRINNIPGVVGNNESFGSAFDDGVRYELGGSYALSPNRKVTLIGHYANADGNDVTLGTVNGAALSGTLSDYERYGVEAGLRQYFRPRAVPIVKGLRPYVEGRLGATNVDDISLNNATLGAAAFNGGTAAFYEGGWVPTAAGLVGVEAPIFNRATLGLETGLRYTGTLDTDTSDFGPGVPLAGTNNGSSNWTVPVMLRGRYRF